MLQTFTCQKHRVYNPTTDLCHYCATNSNPTFIIQGIMYDIIDGKYVQRIPATIVVT